MAGSARLPSVIFETVTVSNRGNNPGTIRINSPGTDDPRLDLQLAGVLAGRLYVDNSDSDRVKIAAGSTPTDAIQIESTGDVTILTPLAMNGLNLNVNNDAAAATDEDPYLALLGGDGVEVVGTILRQDSSADRAYLFQQLASLADNQTDRSTELVLGPIVQVSAVGVDADVTLRMRGHVAAAAVGTFAESTDQLDASASLQLETMPAGFSRRVRIGTATAAANFQVQDSAGVAVLTVDGLGDASVGRDLTVARNLTVSGDTTILNVATVTVEDPLVELGSGNAADVVDLGIYTNYNDGAGRFAGIFRDASDGRFKLFDTLTVEPTTTVATGDASYDHADLQLGALFVDDAATLTGGALFAGSDATGLDEVGFNDAAANASAVGRTRRNGAILTWHDGTAARQMVGGDANLTANGLVYGTAAARVVSLGAATNGQIPIGSTGLAPVLASLTAPAAGVTITGGAGSVTFALANDLGALEGLATTGLGARTAADTWATRSIAAPVAGITVANADGVAGNPTLALANDLSALEGLATTGHAVRSAADTWVTRSVVATSASIVIANGDGVAGNTGIDTAQNIQTSATPQFARLGLGAPADGVAGILMTGLNIGTAAARAGTLFATTLDATSIVSDGSNSLSWSVNEDATTAAENPELIMLGGDGNAPVLDDIVRSAWLQDSVNEETYFWQRRNRAAGGFATIAPRLAIGVRGQTAELNPRLVWNDGSGAAARTADILFDGSAEDLIITSLRVVAAGVLWPDGNGTRDLGDAARRWLAVYAAAVNVSGASTLTGTVTMGANLDHDGSNVGFYGVAPAVRLSGGGAITNSVTAGGVDGTIANYTDLATYSNDAAAIRNDIYQLARSLRLIEIQLRTVGLVS